MRWFGASVTAIVLVIALSPAFAASPTFPDVLLVPAPPAGPVPVPYPANLGPPPSACSPEVASARDAMETARVKAVAAAKKAKLDEPDQKALTDAFYTPAQAYCCLSLPYGMTPIAPGTTDLAWAQVCTAAFYARPGGTWAEVMTACEKKAKEAAANADAASKRPLPSSVKGALGDLSSASANVANKVKSCVAAATPAASPPAGPAKPPCACIAPGCFLEGGACKKNVPQTRTVRKDCPFPPRPPGAPPPPCAAPCFRDAGGACKIDTTETTTSKESCALVCPP